MLATARVVRRVVVRAVRFMVCVLSGRGVDLLRGTLGALLWCVARRPDSGNVTAVTVGAGLPSCAGGRTLGEC